MLALHLLAQEGEWDIHAGVSLWSALEQGATEPKPHKAQTPGNNNSSTSQRTAFNKSSKMETLESTDAGNLSKKQTAGGINQ